MLTGTCFEVSDEELDFKYDKNVNLNAENADEVEFDPIDEWKIITEPDVEPVRYEFSSGDKKPGPQISLDGLEPIDCFQLFFTDDIIKDVVDEINIFAKKKLKKDKYMRNPNLNDWRDVSVNEMKAFIAITIDMGVCIEDVSMYSWHFKEKRNIPTFQDVMTLNRFRKIYTFLYLKKSKNLKSNNSIKLIEYQLLNSIDEKFRENYVPNKNISVSDCELCKMDDLRRFSDLGVKLFHLSDTTNGYVISCLNYYGVLKPFYMPVLGNKFTADVIMHLFDKVIEANPGSEGYHLYADRSYTSISLGKQLLTRRCHMTGTFGFRKNSNMRHIIKTDMELNEMISYRDNDTMILTWNRRKPTGLISTWHTSNCRTIIRGNNGIRQISMPEIIIDYNRTLKHIRMDEELEHVNSWIKEAPKIWQKLFLWAVETCIVNAHILYKEKLKAENRPPISNMEFRYKLVNKLIHAYRVEVDTERLHGQHFLTENSEKKYCIVCSSAKDSTKDKQTYFSCETCTNNPPLHVECMERYHTEKDYKIK